MEIIPAFSPWRRGLGRKGEEITAKNAPGEVMSLRPRSHTARVMPKTGILDITIILRCVLCPYQFHEGDGSLLCPT